MRTYNHIFQHNYYSASDILLQRVEYVDIDGVGFVPIESTVKKIFSSILIVSFAL